MQRGFHYIYEDWINHKGVILNDLEPVGLHKSSSYQGLKFFFSKNAYFYNFVGYKC